MSAASRHRRQTRAARATHCSVLGAARCGAGAVGGWRGALQGRAGGSANEPCPQLRGATPRRPPHRSGPCRTPAGRVRGRRRATPRGWRSCPTRTPCGRTSRTRAGPACARSTRARSPRPCALPRATVTVSNGYSTAPSNRDRQRSDCAGLWPSGAAFATSVNKKARGGGPPRSRMLWYAFASSRGKSGCAERWNTNTCAQTPSLVTCGFHDACG